MPCAHSGLQVGGRCYWCCKQAALNGHRSKLSADQLGFVGFGFDVETDTDPTERGWSSSTSHSHIDKQLEELARLRDVMPGWFELARRILENDGDQS